MRFIDEAKIVVSSGSGGNGCISFRREKYVPRGGPDGGNGGRGGHVYIQGTYSKTSLLDFKFRPKFEAERGEHGKGKDMFGRSGSDLILFLPIGTQVFNSHDDEILFDLTNEKEKFLLAKGGKGGLGNMAFVTSTNQAPRTATPGESGRTIELRLELKLLADVGLIGLPNAGKSSLLCSLSNATSKIANYPFTTLEPHLGVVMHKNNSFIMADLPGLIEGASMGVGLGHKFLKHASRNTLLLHLVEIQSDMKDVINNIHVIRNELNIFFKEEIKQKEEILVFTKLDLFPTDEHEAIKKRLKKHGLNGFFISSHTHYGIPDLLDYIIKKINKSFHCTPHLEASPLTILKM